MPAVLQLVHDGVMAGRPGKERTLPVARTYYFWPTMRVDIDSHISKCVKCAKNKETVPRPAPILEYPASDRPWDVVCMDLLQLLVGNQGSKYFLVCLDHFVKVCCFPISNTIQQSLLHMPP